MGIFEFLYYLGYSTKKYYSFRNQKKLPYKVISIGNITVGGTGKTPATIALAEEAKRRGFSPVILTRGYKGTAKGPCFVSNQQSAISNQQFGDEPVLMAERLKDVPVVKCVDRYKGGMFAIQNFNSQLSSLNSQLLFLLDDGFQHWRLCRDKDVLLIDAESPFDNRRLLPVGPLREPLKEIERADIIVLTKTYNIRQEIINSLIGELKQYNPEAPVFLSGHRPSGFIKPSGETMPVESAKDKNLYAFCGIGNPESFKKTILSTGGLLKGLKVYRDHYRYKPHDIEDILNEAQKNNANWIVTTEKDIMRLKGLNMPENLFALTIEFTIGEKFYDEVFKGI